MSVGRWLLALCLLGVVSSRVCLPADSDAGGTTREPGLAAHYYRDDDHWNGQWPDGVSVPKAKPADWTFTHYRYTRVEPVVNHLFIRSGWFSVRWKGSLDTAVADKRDVRATYKFYVWADDGCRLFIDGKEVISDWRACAENDPGSWRSATVTLDPGRHTIVVEYFQGQSLQSKDRDPIKLYWECADRKIAKQIIPDAQFTHTESDLKPEPGRKD